MDRSTELVRQTAVFRVFFEEPFWVGVFERIREGRVSVSKVTFGAEPIIWVPTGLKACTARKVKLLILTGRRSLSDPRISENGHLITGTIFPQSAGPIMQGRGNPPMRGTGGCDNSLKQL